MFNTKFTYGKIINVREATNTLVMVALLDENNTIIGHNARNKDGDGIWLKVINPPGFISNLFSGIKVGQIVRVYYDGILENGFVELLSDEQSLEDYIRVKKFGGAMRYATK